MQADCMELIDRDALAGLAQDIGLDELAFAAKQFSADAQASADALSRAWLEGDDASVRRLVHRLDGLAMQYGAKAVQVTLRQLRSPAASQQNEALMALLEQVPASIRCLWLTLDELQTSLTQTRP